MSIHSRQKRKQWGCNPNSDCQKMTSIHAAAFSEYSVKPTTYQALLPSAPIWLYCKAMFVMDLLISSASAKAWRQRHITVGVLLEGSMVKTKWHFTETCQFFWLRLGKQSRNQQLLTASTYLTTLLDQRWMMKLQHLQTNKISFCQRMSRTWHEYMQLHSTETTAHQALAPSPPILLCSKLMLATDAFVFSASAKAWKQRQIKAGVFIQGSTVQSWSLKSGEHMTFHSDMWLSLIQNFANNAESDSCLQHLHIWQLALNRDEWWNYRTSKPSKLVSHRMSKT